MDIDPLTLEPFISLLSPHSDLRLTPWRRDDNAHLVVHMNDLKVHMELLGEPFPFTSEHAELAVSRAMAEQAPALALIASAPPNKLSRVAGFPFQVLRRVRTVEPGKLSSGDSPILGRLCLYPHLGGDDQTCNDALRAGEYLEKPAGSMAWELSYWLASDLQGQGVMTCAIETMISKHVIDVMQGGASMKTRLLISLFEGNTRSERLAQRCRFAFIGRVLWDDGLRSGRGEAEISEDDVFETFFEFQAHSGRRRVLRFERFVDVGDLRSK